MTSPWIYRFEAKGIQSFILATDKLREIKGGSSLVEELGGLFEAALEAFGLTAAKGVKKLTLAVAGGASIEVPAGFDGNLRSFMAAWPLLVARHAPGLQLVQARVEGPASRPGAWDEIQADLRAARSRLDPELPEAGPLLLRAPRSGLPATGFDPTGGVAVDAAGERKVSAAARDSLGKRIGEHWSWTENLDDLDHSYVGVLHLDGNDLGNRIKQLAEQRPASELLDFSKKLADGTLAAVQTAVREVLAPAANGGELPGRPVVVGGDDVTFVLRGDLALSFAHVLLRSFEEEHRKALGGPLHASAGLALVHRHHPFRAAHDLAEDLCTLAKKTYRGKGENGATPSSLAFYRLTSASAGRWEEIRHRELAARPPRMTPPAPERWLTLCPYLLDAAAGGPTIDHLRDLVVAFRALPRGPIREWLDLLRADPARAVPHFDRFREVQQRRPGGKEKFAMLEKALEALEASDGWRVIHGRAGGTTLASPVLDALTWQRLEADEEEEP
ncbi:MAG: hypothetical protein QM311_00930 [Acidobacteriota bacterium]|jgi:hypothetical protein|nr:hypothetical protein [Acidobacteriota bacterium]